MKYSSVLMMLFAIFLIALPVTQAAEMTQGPERTQERMQMDRSTVNLAGVVKDVKGDLYTVQDSQGIDWEIHIDKYTDTIGHVLPGVMIMAKVESNGHAKEVKVLSD